MRLTPSFLAYARLTRPVNGVITCASVYVGVFAAGGDVFGLTALLAGAAGWCLCAGANVMNDYLDREVDRINKPERPLINGDAKPAPALALTALTVSVALGISVYLGPRFCAVMVAAALTATAYNLYLKRCVVLGNLTVSAVASLAFFYGGQAGPSPGLALIPTGFALPFHFGREILKDIEDAAGDTTGRVSTVPIAYGTPAALGVATGAFILLILATALPVVADLYGMRYLTLVTVVDLILVYVIRSIWRDASPRNAGRMSGLLKVNMVIGLIAVCMGR